MVLTWHTFQTCVNMAIELGFIGPGITLPIITILKELINVVHRLISKNSKHRNFGHQKSLVSKFFLSSDICVPEILYGSFARKIRFRDFLIKIRIFIVL